MGDKKDSDQKHKWFRFRFRRNKKQETNAEKRAQSSPSDDQQIKNVWGGKNESGKNDPIWNEQKQNFDPEPFLTAFKYPNVPFSNNPHSDALPLSYRSYFGLKDGEDSSSLNNSSKPIISDGSNVSMNDQHATTLQNRHQESKKSYAGCLIPKVYSGDRHGDSGAIPYDSQQNNLARFSNCNQKTNMGTAGSNDHQQGNLVAGEPNYDQQEYFVLYAPCDDQQRYFVPCAPCYDEQKNLRACVLTAQQAEAAREKCVNEFQSGADSMHTNSKRPSEPVNQTAEQIAMRNWFRRIIEENCKDNDRNIYPDVNRRKAYQKLGIKSTEN